MGLKKAMLSVVLAAVWLLSLAPGSWAAEHAVRLEPIAAKQPGERLTIKGETGLEVLVLQILRPNQTILWTDTVSRQELVNGQTLTLPLDAPAGTYTVLAGAGEVKASVTFEVAADRAPGPIGYLPPAPANENPPGVPGRLHDSAMTLQWTEHTQGVQSLRAIVEEEGLTDALRELAPLEDKRLLIELDNEGAAVELVLPIMPFAALDQELSEAVLLIILDSVRYELPVAAMDLSGLEAHWRLLVSIGPPDAPMQRQLETALAQANAVELVQAVSFRIQVDTGDAKREMSLRSGMYIPRELLLPEGSSLEHATGAWLDAASGELRFVPARIESGAGASWARLMRQGNSVYTVVELHKAFADLDGHWARPQVERLASMLILKGQSEHAYVPAASVTRAEFASMLVRALGLNEQMAEGGAERFSDVRSGAWYEAALAAAGSAGLVQGYEDGTFRPAATISREQMAVMLIRAIRYAERAWAASCRRLMWQLDRPGLRYTKISKRWRHGRTRRSPKRCNAD
ncbi:S-layer homology domain-containing protein [Paenibacillus sp. 1P07SE]|uniref:S-layer homology domain-containing protein n=1 Tax=Paenibacillus sp. 1P07SE TaxID=3132209 RepID=UPI0039A51563